MTIQQAFELMLKNKKVRITQEFRKEIKSNDNYFTDTWFFIQAITCDSELTLCGNNHTIIENVKLNEIAN